jgi:hypothetical protein
MLPSFKLNKIKSEKGLNEFIDSCKILFPNTKNVSYNQRSVIDIDILTVDNYLSVSTHKFVKESKKLLFRDLRIALYNKEKKSYNEIFKITCSSENSYYVLEEFLNGYERTEHTLEKYEMTDNDLSLKLYTIGPLEIFYIYYEDELCFFGFRKQKILRCFYEFKSGNKAIAYLPLLHDNEITISKSSIAYALSMLGSIIALMVFFQNIFFTLGIMLFSAAVLWVNDFINPRRHPVLNIIQAIIIAVVIFFVR